MLNNSAHKLLLTLEGVFKLNKKRRLFASKVISFMLATILLLGVNASVGAMQASDSLLPHYLPIVSDLSEEHVDIMPFLQLDTVRDDDSDAGADIDLTHLVYAASEMQENRHLYSMEVFSGDVIDVAYFNTSPEDVFMVDDIHLPILSMVAGYATPYNIEQQQRTSETADVHLYFPEYFVDEENLIYESEYAQFSTDPITRNAVVTFVYRGNGHTGGAVPTSHSNVTPSLVTLRPQGTMVRNGHVFIGWRDTAGTLFTPGTIIPAGGQINFPFAFSGTVTLDAHWEQAIVTFQYRSTGHTSGTVPASHSLITPGSVQLRPQGTLRRTGHVLVGWRDTQGMLFPPGTVIPLGHTLNFTSPNRGTVTLDAHWVPAIVRIEYRGNGHTSGTVPASHSIQTPGSVPARAPGNLTRTGHVFYAWRTASGQFVDPGVNIVFSTETEGTLVLYAHWIPAIVRIEYRGNGHTGGAVPAAHQFTTPGSTTLRGPGNMIRTNHVFGGWTQGGEIFPVGAVVGFSTPVAGTVVLNAHWIPSGTVTIRFNGNSNTGGNAPANITLQTPGTITLPGQGTLVRTGRRFTGWRSADGSGLWFAGSNFGWTAATSGTFDLYAVWGVFVNIKVQQI